MFSKSLKYFLNRKTAKITSNNPTIPNPITNTANGVLNIPSYSKKSNMKNINTGIKQRTVTKIMK